MDDSQESTPVESTQPSSEEVAAKRAKRKLYLIIGGGVFLLLLANTIALYVLFQRMTPKPIEAVPVPVAAPPTKEQLEAAARLAELKKVELNETHHRILGESSFGIIQDLPQTQLSIKKKQLKAVPENPTEPVAPTPTSSAVVPDASKKLPVTDKDAKELKDVKETPEKKPPVSLTPMGSLGYGVSKDNIEGLTTIIEGMNQTDAGKEKKRGTRKP